MFSFHHDSCYTFEVLPSAPRRCLKFVYIDQWFSMPKKNSNRKSRPISCLFPDDIKWGDVSFYSRGEQ